MFNDPVGLSMAWAEGNLSGDRLRQFREYSYAVRYHLRLAATAASDSYSPMYEMEWGLSSKTGSLYIHKFDSEKVVANGDIAIREATSALDTTLMLVYGMHRPHLPRTKVHWNKDPAMESLHRALVRKLGANGAGLISALNTIFRSIGYDLLAGYRNWVTHCGVTNTASTETI